MWSLGNVVWNLSQLWSGVGSHAATSGQQLGSLQERALPAASVAQGSVSGVEACGQVLWIKGNLWLAS